MTHKEYTNPEDNLYRPLHVGRAISEDLFYEGDDSGDSISIKNKNYCELTGLYWIYKNIKCDIVGICHYRRYFVKNEDFLNQEYIEGILKDYDIIVPFSGDTEYSTNLEHYKEVHYIKDMEICKDVVLSKHPNYKEAFDLFLNTNLASLGNMFIARKEIFDEYCQWLFGILFEVEKRIDISNYDPFQARIFGYLSERLFRIWLFMHEYKVKEEEVRMIDPAESDNGVKAVNLKYRMCELILKNITDSYVNGNPYDLVDNSPNDIDFKGKTPVWICWWQGENLAPELVKKCLLSIRNNIPSDLANIYIISFDNVGDYISLPNWVIEKFNQGKLSYAHLSDILRMGLLYRYGGLWLDATYYMTAPFPKEIFNNKVFYTHRTATPKWKADITKGRWSINLLKGDSGNILFRYVLNALYEYWDLRDEVFDYYLFDYIFALAYEKIPEAKRLIDSCGYSQPKIFELKPLLNQKFNQTVFDELTKETNIFKLSYRDEVIGETLLDELTFYSKL